MMGKRKGSWTPEEDNKLVNCINLHGPGRWDYLAECAGLERSGKSCRLRWLNYLRPDLRHDDITLEEQLHIIELQLEWGNKWAKIAESLPGRTDNDVKNYWRTRVHRRAQDLNCDIDSPQFKHIMLNSWMPRLAEQIQTTFRYDDPVESSPTSMVINNIHGRPSIIQEGTIHSSNTTSSTLENEGQTRRLGNHAGGHLIKWDEISSLTQQSPAGSGDGSQCSRIQMDTYTSPHNTTCSTHFFHGDILELDHGPFGLNHFMPDGRLPSLNCCSSPLSSDVHLSPASEPTHNLTSGHDIFQLDQNDYGLKKTQDGSVSEPEFLCDGGIEVDNILANFELLMSDENMIRDLQQLLYDDDLN